MEQSSEQPVDTLGELVKSITFKKVSPALLALPAAFAAPAAALLLLSLSRIMGQLRALDMLDAWSILQALSYMQWSLVLSIGFMASTAIASYILLRDLREHMYYSGIATYYFKGGRDFVSGLYYLKNSLERSSLPAPATGLLLAFLTSGLSYPILLCIAEKALREHIALEEEALLNKRLTKRYGAADIVLDLLLVVATLELYVAYMAVRHARTFNKHVDLIHGSHPNPPAIPEQQPPEEREVSYSAAFTGLLLVVLGIGILASYLGLYVTPYVVLSAGLALVGVSLSTRSLLKRALLLYLLLYVFMASGVAAGIAGFETYKFLLSVFNQLEEQSRILSRSFTSLLAYIFTNNFSISYPASLPTSGAITLATGIFNAGVLLGVLVASGLRGLRALLVIVMPHALLELAGYAVLVSAAGSYRNPREFTRVVALGVALLFIAALVEAVTIAYPLAWI